MKPIAKFRLHRKNLRSARLSSRFGDGPRAGIPSTYRLVGVEEVTPDVAVAAEDARIGFTVEFYEHRQRPEERLTITRGYTTPARVAGAPEGSWGSVEVGGHAATWISGFWEVADPTASAAPSSQAADARWVEGEVRLSWQDEDKVSTTLEATHLGLDELIAVAESLV